MIRKKPLELLNDEVRLLQSKQDYELALLRQQYAKTTDSLRPANIISSTFKNVVKSSDTGSALIDSTIGMVTGFLTKKLLVGTSANPLKKVVGTLLQFGLSNIVYKNSFAIKAAGSNIFRLIFGKKKEAEIPVSEITVLKGDQ